MSSHPSTHVISSFNEQLSTDMQVLRLALADSGLGSQDVGSIEMHGTGTALGDPIEVGALLPVFEGKWL